MGLKIKMANDDDEEKETVITYMQIISPTLNAVCTFSSNIAVLCLYRAVFSNNSQISQIFYILFLDDFDTILS